MFKSSKEISVKNLKSNKMHYVQHFNQCLIVLR